MKIKNHCKVDIKGLEMEKALKFLIKLKQSRDFDGNLEYSLDKAIAELEEAMKPKTCEGCKHSKVTISSVICGKNGTYKEADDYCKYFMPKDNA